MTRRRFSPLTRRILTVNILPLAILAAGILYLDEYRERLIDAELAALRTQAEIFAGALGEGAIGTRADGGQVILPDIARPMLRRLVLPTRNRARVFEADGSVVADSRFLGGQVGIVRIEPLPELADVDLPTAVLIGIYDTLVGLFPDSHRDPPFPMVQDARAEAFPVVGEAFGGNTRTARWSLPHGGLLLGAAAPIQRFKQVLGVVLVTGDAAAVEAGVRAVRFDVLRVFAVALAVTIALSFYLSGAIAGPVRRLAAAADNVRRGHGRADNIPDFSRRRDEIGELSASLREMTDALWQRMVANERFAADVAHEIKNPLTSLRSAVETAARVRDPERQATLMAIIGDDVKRLDRLISDISDASRLDAELARTQLERIDLGRLLQALAQVHQTTAADASAPRVVFRGNPVDCAVLGIEGRLVQVFQNLISNARSFTPPGGEIAISVFRDRADVVARVDDQGPGIPPNNLESIFERFYSERPEGESFGRHSGLGLSISRQIVEAHGGEIHAENILRQDGTRAGARFVVRLPAAVP
jgi:two-component system sensor histidine kinase ChvG